MLQDTHQITKEMSEAGERYRKLQDRDNINKLIKMNPFSSISMFSVNRLTFQDMTYSG